MEEIIKLLEDGNFIQHENVIMFPSGKKIWTANGSYSLRFSPESGAGFTFTERMRLMQAIKKGRIKQALSTPRGEE